jgi:hypothetical protein
MKKTFFVMALFVACGLTIVNAATVVSNASVTSVASAFAAPPPAVLKSFTAFFGNARVFEWKQRSNGQWRAHFLRNGRAWEATFTSAGVLVKSEPA